jgi:hypothetical protein
MLELSSVVCFYAFIDRLLVLVCWLFVARILGAIL